MARRFTKRSPTGKQVKSTLLTGLKKMKMYHRQARTNQRLTESNDTEGTLNKMSMWLGAVAKCPPRHYGKVWIEEKDVILRQCEQMYLDAQKHSQKTRDTFMGVKRNRLELKGQDGDGRFMPLSRLTWNMASAKWDFTNRVETGKNPYWNVDESSKKRKVKILKGNEKSWALYDMSVKIISKEQETEDAMKKVVQPFSEWKLGKPRTGPVGGPTAFPFSELGKQSQHCKVSTVAG
jgi:hypothetical protein